MKNWKIVWRSITGTIFCANFDFLEEVEEWLDARRQPLHDIAETLTVYEFYDNEYKQRYHWARA